jgi:hypothetical protein
VQDRDYESEDEDYYDVDVPQNHRLTSVLVDDEDEDDVLVGALAGGESGGGGDSRGLRWDSDSGGSFAGSGSEDLSGKPRSMSTSSTTSSTSTSSTMSLARVYGDKADEMQKFYNIMMAAETSSAKAAAAPVSAPAPVAPTNPLARRNSSKAVVTAASAPTAGATASASGSLGGVKPVDIGNADNRKAKKPTETNDVRERLRKMGRKSLVQGTSIFILDYINLCRFIYLL